MKTIDVTTKELHTYALNGIDITTQLNQTVLQNDYHSHEFYEIFYIVDGNIRHTLNGVTATLSLGDGYILSPKSIHQIKYNKPSLHRDLLISVPFFENILSLVFQKSDTSFLFDTPLHFSPLEIIEMEDILTRFSNTENVWTKRSIGIAAVVKILQKFETLPSDDATHQKKLSDKIKELLNRPDVLQQGIPAIVQHLQYSEAHINRIFKKETGYKLSNYLKHIRMKRCAYYLVSTNYTLREIADLLGIESLAYLNNCFKETYYTTPIVYRKKGTSQFPEKEDTRIK